MPTPNNVYSKMGVVYKLLYSHSLFSFCKLIGCRRGQIRTDVPVKGEWWPTWAGFTPAVCSNPLGGSPRTLHLCALLQLVFPSCHPLFVEARLCSGGGNRTLLPEVMSLWFPMIPRISMLQMYVKDFKHTRQSNYFLLCFSYSSSPGFICHL